MSATPQFSQGGTSYPSPRHLFRHVQIEGLSFFPDQDHVRLHCRVKLGKRVTNAGLQADYALVNQWLSKLPNPVRLRISECLSEGLIAGGKRWNFIDLRTQLEQRFSLRRCLIELQAENPAKKENTTLKIKAISL